MKNDMRTNLAILALVALNVAALAIIAPLAIAGAIGLGAPKSFPRPDNPKGTRK